MKRRLLGELEAGCGDGSLTYRGTSLIDQRRSTTVTQLQITSLVTMCGTDSDDCQGLPAEGSWSRSLGADKGAATGVLDKGGRVDLA